MSTRLVNKSALVTAGPSGSLRRPITVQTGLSYAVLVAAFEREVGHWDADAGARLVAENADWEKTRDTIGRMAGHQGLMIVAKLNQGEIASLSRTPRLCLVYLVGNPIIATDIFKVDIRAGMLVPFRVEVYDDGKGGALSYDLPSSFLASLEQPELVEIGKSLDQNIGSEAQTQWVPSQISFCSYDAIHR
jgi:uncharacterized protein (DUF302 family)